MGRTPPSSTRKDGESTLLLRAKGKVGERTLALLLLLRSDGRKRERKGEQTPSHYPSSVHKPHPLRSAPRPRNKPADAGADETPPSSGAEVETLAGGEGAGV